MLLRCKSLEPPMSHLGLKLGLTRSTLDVRFEPPRVDRRLQLLRRWSHDEADQQQVFSRGPGARGPDGCGPRGRARIAMGGNCGQDRLYGTNAQRMREEGRGRGWPACGRAYGFRRQAEGA